YQNKQKITQYMYLKRMPQEKLSFKNYFQLKLIYRSSMPAYLRADTSTMFYNIVDLLSTSSSASAFENLSKSGYVWSIFIILKN
ncbi:MAG: hypothetical protein ACKO96_49535, partial [Flammeovirgaceae bacterium]